ncbi:hypothetical protein ACOIP5_005065 [Salmonella enterica]
MKHIIIFCLLVVLASCSTVKDVKKGVIPPSCPLCQHSLDGVRVQPQGTWPGRTPLWRCFRTGGNP